jgi:hypothetical protein
MGDTPLQAGKTLQAEVARYLTAYLGDKMDLSAFSFTTRRSEVDASGAFWLHGCTYLTKLPVVGSLKGML